MVDLDDVPGTSSSGTLQKINLNRGLNEIDRNNLLDMSLDLPSDVYKNKTADEMLDKIKTKNRSIGQLLGRAPERNKPKLVYIYKKGTLEKY